MSCKHSIPVPTIITFLPPATRLSTRWEIFSQLLKYVYLYSFKVVAKEKRQKSTLLFKNRLCFCPCDLYIAATPTLAKATQLQILKGDIKLYFRISNRKGQPQFSAPYGSSAASKEEEQRPQRCYAIPRTERFNLRYINAQPNTRATAPSPPCPKMAPAPHSPAGSPPPPAWRTHLQSLGRAPAPPAPPLRRRAAPPPPALPASPLVAAVPPRRCNQWEERKELCAREAPPHVGPPTSRCSRSPAGLRPLAVGSAGAALDEKEEEKEKGSSSSRRRSRRGPGRGPEGCGSDLGPEPWPQARPMPASQPERHPGPCPAALGAGPAAAAERSETPT